MYVGTKIVQQVNEWVHRIMYETGRQMNDQMGKQIDTDIFSRIDKYNNELIEHTKMYKAMSFQKIYTENMLTFSNTR